MLKLFRFRLGERDPVRVSLAEPPGWEDVTLDPIIHDASRYAESRGDVVHGQFVREL